MKRKPIIHPFAYPNSLSEDALKVLGFRFTRLSLDRTPENWLCLSVDWRLSEEKQDEEYKVKYTTLDCSSSGCGGGREELSVWLEFSQIPAPYTQDNGKEDSVGKDNKACIELGIRIQTGRALNPPRLGYRYQFYQNTKYGAAVWFSPDGWAGGKWTNLSSWRERKPKALAVKN